MMLDIAAVKQSADIVGMIGRDTKLDGGPNEFYGPCPKCGGDDRMHVHRTKGWFCRICKKAPGEGGHWNDAIDYIMFRDECDFATAYNKLGGSTTLSADEYRKMQVERQERDAERRQVEQATQAERRQTLNQSKAWVSFYQSLDEYSRHLWYGRGLSDTWIDYFQVGYAPSHTFYYKGEAFTSSTLTIPTFRHNLSGQNLTWSCVGLSHRLLLDDAPGGKYRPHLSGTGKPLFCADLYMPIMGDVLIVEGEIKAMVTWAHVQTGDGGKHNSPLGNLQVIGMPGKAFKAEWVDELIGAERIWLCLDPDATSEAYHAADMLGRERCRIIQLPGKIDDMFNEFSLTVKDLAGLISVARRM
jgi:hypothetical protein